MRHILVVVCILLVACNGYTPSGGNVGVEITPADGSAQKSQPAFTLKNTQVSNDSRTATSIHSLLQTSVPTQTEKPRLTLTPTPSPTATQEPEPTIYPTDTAEPLLPAGAINWSEAANHIGERQIVCGPVVEATYASSTNGQPTFINMGEKYPDPERFSVLIWGKYRYKFPSAPESLYLNKYICVTGPIVSYKGLAEVEITDPSKITIQ